MVFDFPGGSKACSGSKSLHVWILHVCPKNQGKRIICLRKCEFPLGFSVSRAVFPDPYLLHVWISACVGGWVVWPGWGRRGHLRGEGKGGFLRNSGEREWDTWGDLWGDGEDVPS